MNAIRKCTIAKNEHKFLDFFTFYPVDFEPYYPFIWIAFFAKMRHFVTSDKNDRHIIFHFYN